MEWPAHIQLVDTTWLCSKITVLFYPSIFTYEKRGEDKEQIFTYNYSKPHPPPFCTPTTSYNVVLSALTLYSYTVMLYALTLYPYTVMLSTLILYGLTRSTVCSLTLPNTITLILLTSAFNFSLFSTLTNSSQSSAVFSHVQTTM